MGKQDAIKLFGGAGKMAEALGITTQTIRTWNNELTPQQSDRVNGAYLRISTERQEAAKHYFGWLK
jgi:hypothetical protein